MKNDDIGMYISNIDANMSNFMLKAVKMCINDVNRVSNALINGEIPQSNDLGMWYNNPTIQSAEDLVELTDYIVKRPEHLYDQMVRIEQMFRHTAKYYSFDINEGFFSEKVKNLVSILLKELLNDIIDVSSRGFYEEKEREIHHKVGCVQKATRKLAELSNETNPVRFVNLMIDASIDLLAGFNEPYDEDELED